MTKAAPKDNFIQLLDDLQAWQDVVERGATRDEFRAYTDVPLRGGELLTFTTEGKQLGYLSKKWTMLNGKASFLWSITQKGRDLLAGKVKREKPFLYRLLADRRDGFEDD